MVLDVHLNDIFSIQHLLKNFEKEKLPVKTGTGLVNTATGQASARFGMHLSSLIQSYGIE